MSTRDSQDSVFRALADHRRRAMLDLLKDQPLSTGELCLRFSQLDRCTVMQHLGVLEQAELIVVQRKGRVRMNYLNALPIQEIYDRWISRYAQRAVGILADLAE